VGKLYFCDRSRKQTKSRHYRSREGAEERGRKDRDVCRPGDSQASRCEQGNGIALFDVVNRGRGVALAKFDAPVAGAGSAPADEYGDGFLLNRGYTIVQVGWEFDARREGRFGRRCRAAIGITGLARATFIPTSNSPEATVGDLVGYTPRDPAALENTLTVRDSPQAAATTIPRAKWHLTGNVVTARRRVRPRSHLRARLHGSEPARGGLGIRRGSRRGVVGAIRA
jgi:hypothetical protein